MIMKKTDFLKNSVIAHRGVFDNKKVVENTLESFKKAIYRGYTIELDIRLTKDNKVIVFHDADLDRLTDKKGKLEYFSLDEVKKIKLLNKSNIPTLDEVLELVNGRVPLLIELKPCKGLVLEKEVVKILRNYNGEYAIQSFNPKTVLWFRIFKKDIIRGLLISNKKLISLRLLKVCKPNFINVNKNLLNNDIIKKYKGIKLAYTIDKSEKEKYSDKCDNMICNI